VKDGGRRAVLGCSLCGARARRQNSHTLDGDPTLEARFRAFGRRPRNGRFQFVVGARLPFFEVNRFHHHLVGEGTVGKTTDAAVAPWPACVACRTGRVRCSGTDGWQHQRFAIPWCGAMPSAGRWTSWDSRRWRVDLLCDGAWRVVSGRDVVRGAILCRGGWLRQWRRGCAGNRCEAAAEERASLIKRNVSWSRYWISRSRLFVKHDRGRDP